MESRTKVFAPVQLFDAWSLLLKDSFDDVHFTPRTALACIGIDDLSKVIESVTSISEDVDTNEISELIDWCLAEAGECSEILVLSTGQFFDGDRDDWTKRQSLDVGPFRRLSVQSGDIVQTAQQRTNRALEILRILADVETVRTSYIFKEERQNVLRRLSAAGVDVKDLMAAFNMADETAVATKPISEIIEADFGDCDLYAVKNGLRGYEEAIQRLLDKSTGLQWNLNVLTTLLEAGDMICDVKQIRPMVDNLPLTQKITDIRVSKNYVELFKRGFTNLALSEKKQIMNEYFQKHGAVSFLTTNQNSIDAELTIIINQLTQTNKSELLRRMAESLSWYFMVAFKETWQKLVHAAFRTPALIAVVIDIVRELLPVSAARVYTEANSKSAVFAEFVRLWERNEVKNNRDELAWIEFVKGLFFLHIPKHIVNSKEKVPESKADITENLRSVVLPILRTHPRLAVPILTALFSRPLCNVTWSFSVPKDGSTDKENGCINAPDLFVTIVDVIMKNMKENGDNVNFDGVDLWSRPLMNFVQFLHSNGHHFPKETVVWIEKLFDTLPWPFYLSVMDCLCIAAEEECKPRLPLQKCIFEVFKMPDSEYRPVECSDWNKDHPPMICALGGIFSLGCQSPELAKSILQVVDSKIFVEKVKEKSFRGDVVRALKNVLADKKAFSHWQGCTSTLDAVVNRIAAEDESWKMENNVVDDWGYSEGIRQMAALLILGDAIRAIIEQDPGFTVLRHFSNIAKNIVAQRVQNMKKPLAKVAAVQCVFFQCCGISGTLNGASGDLGPLLLTIFDFLKRERFDVDKYLLNITKKSLSTEHQNLLAAAFGNSNF